MSDPRFSPPPPPPNTTTTHTAQDSDLLFGLACSQDSECFKSHPGDSNPQIPLRTIWVEPRRVSEAEGRGGRKASYVTIWVVVSNRASSSV